MIKRLAALFNSNTPWNQPVSRNNVTGAATTLLSREAVQGLTELAIATDELRDPPRGDHVGSLDQNLGSNPMGVVLTFPNAGAFSRAIEQVGNTFVTPNAGTYLISVSAQFTIGAVTAAALVALRNGTEVQRMTQSATVSPFGAYWSTLVQASAGDAWSIAADFPTGAAVTALAGRRLQILRTALA